MAAAEQAEMARSGLSAAEREAWLEQGFFFREAAFTKAELAALGDAAEAVVRRAQDGLAAGGESYAIDGNTYVELQLAGRAACRAGGCRGSAGSSRCSRRRRRG